jgi:hypothetical protein
MTEITTRIARDELNRLLDTMTPAAQQSITTRASISDIQAELARHGKAEPVAVVEPPAPAPALAAPLFDGVDWDNLLTTAVSTIITPRPLPPPIVPTPADAPRANRKYARPFSHVAALLPPTEAARSRRVTRPPMLTTRQTGPIRSLAVAEPKPVRSVEDLRERLDAGQELGARPITASDAVIAEALSPQVVAQLSTEEIAMLPARVRDSLVPTPVPLSTRPEVQPLVTRPRLVTLVASFTVSFLAALSAAYFLA